MRMGVVQVAAQQVEIEIPVRVEVTARIHRHETGVLQEAWIDLTTVTRVVGRHGVDHVALEPAQRLGRGEIVDLRRAAARIDRAAHHGHAARRGFAARGHQRNRRQHRYGWLAHRDHVQRFGADVADELLDGRDVIVQMNGPADAGTMRASVQSVMYTL